MSTPHPPLASRRQLLVGGGAAAAGLLLAPPPPASASTAESARGAAGTGARGFDSRQLLRWAADTMRSLESMTFPGTGLISDNIPGSLAPGAGSRYTSPTNIGGYLWSAVVARDLGLITPARQRPGRQTLKTLLRMDRHEPSGMYYNWYDPATGDVLTTWPRTAAPSTRSCPASTTAGWRPL